MNIPSPIFWLFIFIGFAQCNEEGKHQFVRFHSRNIIFLFPVIIVSGGYGSYDEYTKLTSVEVLSPSGAPLSCTVPLLPTLRHRHTQDGEVACGGGDYGAATRRSCVTLTGEGWQESHQLQQGRGVHSSWRSPAGLLLMGGYYSGNTTEILSATYSSTTSSFTLAYNTQ